MAAFDVYCHEAFEELPLATAGTVHVAVDPRTGRSTGLAAPLRQLLEKYQAVPAIE